MSDTKRLIQMEIFGINSVVTRVHENAVAKGFWERFDRYAVGDLGFRLSVDQQLALMALIHTEVSEACEAIRLEDDRNFAEELADIVIRVFDVAAGTGVDIGHEIATKMAINKGREKMHGKKA